MAKYLLIIIASIILVFGGLFWAIRTTDNTSLVGVSCLPNGHQSLAMHIHPEVTVVIDNVSIPATEGIGLSPCMYELHVHQGQPGVIHAESPTQRDFTIEQFLSVWEATGHYPLEGKTITGITVDGQPYSGDYKTLVMLDRAKIVINAVTP